MNNNDLPEEWIRALEEWSLTAWCRLCFMAFKNVIDEKRSIYHNILEPIWLQVVEEAAELAEAHRYMETKSIEDNISGVFAWFCIFIESLKEEIKTQDGKSVFIEVLKDRVKQHLQRVFGEVEINFQNIMRHIETYYADYMVFLKYPYHCPFCACEENCNCLGMTKKDYDTRKELFEGELIVTKLFEKLCEKNKIKLSSNNIVKIDLPNSLLKWRKIFDKIYGRLLRVQVPEQVGFHLSEEIGEVARALRKLREVENKGEIEEIKREMKNLQNELADVFDWLIAIIKKIEIMTGKEKEEEIVIRISELVMRHPKYGRGIRKVLQNVFRDFSRRVEKSFLIEEEEK